jgi:hypothetical protein
MVGCVLTLLVYRCTSLLTSFRCCLSSLPMVVYVAWAGVVGMVGSSLVINLEKKYRTLLIVKRTMKEGK